MGFTATNVAEKESEFLKSGANFVMSKPLTGRLNTSNFSI